MPRYLVERLIPRAGELTSQELKAIVEQKLLVQQQFEARLLWMRSIITTDRMVCLYIADTEATVRENDRQTGLPIQRISEVSTIIDPGTAGQK